MLKDFFFRLVKIAPVLILVFAFPFFFFGGTTETSSNLFGVLWDCGHLVFFIALVLAVNKKCNVNNWRVALTISAAVFIGGGLIEIIQASIGRDGNWEDLFRDMTGTWLGLFWVQSSNRWVWLGRVGVTLCLLPNLAAVFFEAWYALHTAKTFPLLAGFESDIETHWDKRKSERSALYHSQGKYSLKVALDKKPFHSIKFGRLQRDWRGFKQLKFDIYNPDTKALDMVVRVNDTQHKQSQWATADRFNASFNLKPGWNYLAFPVADMRLAPANRLMDLSQVSWLEIFANGLSERRLIYIDNLRLE